MVPDVAQRRREDEEPHENQWDNEIANMSVYGHDRIPVTKGAPSPLYRRCLPEQKRCVAADTCPEPQASA